VAEKKEELLNMRRGIVRSLAIEIAGNPTTVSAVNMDPDAMEKIKNRAAREAKY